MTRSSSSSKSQGGRPPAELQEQLDLIGREGGTPLAVCRDNHVLGVVYLKDIVKEGMSARFDELRRMGISTVMVTGDNRLTAAKIAEESGVDDFLPGSDPGAEAGADPHPPGRRPDGRDGRRRDQ